jgi:hypothetical protein
MSAMLDGMLIQYYFHVAVDDNERAEGLERMCKQMLNYYMEITQKRQDPLRLPSYEQMKRSKLEQLLDEKNGFVPELRERLRRKLGLPQAAPVPEK